MSSRRNYAIAQLSVIARLPAARVLVRECELGNLELLTCTPVKSLALMICMLSPFFVLGFA